MSRMIKAAAALILVGVCGSAHAQTCEGQWLPGSAGFDDEIRALAPYQGQLVVAGEFDNAPGIAAEQIVRWNGVSWSGMNADRISSPRALRVYDETLHVGGWFQTTFSPATGVAQWNGSAWEALAQPLPTMSFSSQVNSFAEYQGKLVAGGRLRVSGPSNDAAFLWDGSNWQSAGAVLSSGASVLSTAVYQGNLYIAGNAMWLTGNSTSGGVLRYDGTTWSKVGPNGLEGGGSAIALRVYQDKLIIASRFVRTAGAFNYGPVASWDGITVSTVGSGSSINGDVAAMTEYAGDLILGGSFTDGFGVGANGIVRWNGTNFAALGQGIAGTSSPGRRVNALEVFQGELLVGGDFDTAGGMSSPYFARWTDNPTPWVAVSPESKPVNEGLTLTLSAAAASGYANVSYQWRRNGVDVTDGPGGASAGGGTVSGASGTLASPSDGASVMLTVAGVQASDAGDYTIEFDNSCNATTSSIATVSVNTCPGDLNADGFVNDADFELFVSAYNILLCEDASMPVGCLSDLNGDGVVDDADFQLFVVAYDALVCE